MKPNALVIDDVGGGHRDLVSAGGVFGRRESTLRL